MLISVGDELIKALGNNLVDVYFARDHVLEALELPFGTASVTITANAQCTYLQQMRQQPL